MAHGIYKIVNIITGKIYVGSAVNLDRRFKEHQTALKHNKHFAKKLQNSYNKYGIENFKYETLEIVENKLFLIKREQYWIDNLNSFNKGYNSRPLANSSLGIKASEETRRKQAAAKIGTQHHLGFKHSDEAKRKMSKVNKGKLLSEEHKKAISLANKGLTRNIGRKASEETKAKTSAAIKKHWETRERKWNPNHKITSRGNDKKPRAKKKLFDQDINLIIETFGTIDF